MREKEEWQPKHKSVWLQEGEAVPQTVKLGQGEKKEEQEGLE